MDDLSELVSDLTYITKKQANIIDRITQMLLQYIAIEELEDVFEEQKEVRGIYEKWEV